MGDSDGALSGSGVRATAIGATSECKAGIESGSEMYTFGYFLNSFEHSLKLLLFLTLLLFNNICLSTRDFSPSSRFQSFLLINNNILTFNCLSCWSLQDFFLLIHSFYLLIHSFLNSLFFIGVIYYQLPF